MNKAILKQYSLLVDFLAASLGPDYEVVLHDLGDSANSIVAIANGRVSGRTLGAPLTTKALEMMAARSYENEDFHINYSSLSGDGRVLRSSSLFVKDPSGRPVALLCINFDDSRYEDVCTRVLKLCHPDAFVERNSPKAVISLPAEDREAAERFPNSLEAVTESVVSDVVARHGVPVDRLTQEEKLCIVEALDRKGVFLLKGAVSHVAAALKSSEASIYRYLGKLGKGKARP